MIQKLAADLGEGAVAVPTDVTDAEAVKMGTERVQDELGQIGAVILNATGGGGRPIDNASVERRRSIFDTRVADPLACVQAVLPGLRETDGTVVFSGTAYAEGVVSEQIECSAVAPAAGGLATSLDAALSQVQVTYLSIGTSVAPVGTTRGAQQSLDASELASLYSDLVKRDRAVTREIDMFLRG